MADAQSPHQANASGSSGVHVVLDFVLVVFLIIASSAVFAEPVSISFTGVATYANQNPYFGSPNNIVLGSQVNGLYRFESTLAPVTDATAPANGSRYRPLGSLQVGIDRYSLELGGYAPGFASSWVYVADDLPLPSPFAGADVYSIFGGSVRYFEFRISLTDQWGTALTSTALPSLPPSLDAFTSNTWTLSAPGETYDRNGWDMQVIASGHLTSLQLTPIPLPAAAWLMMSGLAAIAPLGCRPNRRKPGSYGETEGPARC